MFSNDNDFKDLGYDVDSTPAGNEIKGALASHIKEEFLSGECAGFNVVPISRIHETVGVCSKCKKVLERWKKKYEIKNKEAADLAIRTDL